MFTQVLEDKCSHILSVGILHSSPGESYTAGVFQVSVWRGGQKPWWEANKKRFVTAQGAVLALDHHRHRHGDRIPGSLTLLDTIFFLSSWLTICLKTVMLYLLVL